MSRNDDEVFFESVTFSQVAIVTLVLGTLIWKMDVLKKNFPPSTYSKFKHLVNLIYNNDIAIHKKTPLDRLEPKPHQLIIEHNSVTVLKYISSLIVY